MKYYLPPIPKLRRYVFYRHWFTYANSILYRDTRFKWKDTPESSKIGFKFLKTDILLDITREEYL